MATHYGYELGKLQSWELIKGIDVAIEENYLKNFSFVGSKIRDLIHGIPSSFNDIHFSVSQMEIYLGCCRTDRLFERFTSHYYKKNHTFGLIVGCSDLEHISYLEKTGIRLLKKLENMEKLCVANAGVHGYKGENNDEVILIYMTWKIDQRIKNIWDGPNKDERQTIYQEIVKESRDDAINQTTNWRDHIWNVVDEVHKKTAKEKVYWHPRHS